MYVPGKAWFTSSFLDKFGVCARNAPSVHTICIHMHPGYQKRVSFWHVLGWYALEYATFFLYCIGKCSQLYFPIQWGTVKKKNIHGIKIFFTIEVTGWHWRLRSVVYVGEYSRYIPPMWPKTNCEQSLIAQNSKCLLHSQYIFSISALWW